MHIQKLEFFVSPLKLYAYLNQGVRKDRLLMLQDATEEGYTVIAYGPEVLTSKIENPTPEKIREVCDELSGVLEKQGEELEKYLEGYVAKADIERFPFLYGLVGFFSYDLGLGFEKIESSCVDDRGYPSYYFVVPEEVLIIDHETKQMWVVHRSDEPDVDFYEGLRTIHFKEPVIMTDKDEKGVDSNLTEYEYGGKIAEVKNYLTKGETYQVNFSQRFSFESLKSPWEVYKKVTEVNPSKYQAFLSGKMGYEFNSKQFWVASNSPERLFRVRVEDGLRVIETRPIKGTAGFTGNETEEELELIGQGLVQSDKDRAELEMIVDMSRNDLGRVCEFGSVEVTEHRVLEKYSHLFHTVSNVAGRLKKNVTLYDVLRALFPGASITGCPKKRTMEIIDELEQYARGVYCGSMGYLDCRGVKDGILQNADFNIMIRTLFANERRSGGYRYVMHSGGGIVIDSKAELEFQETFDKVSAFLTAITSD